MPLPGPIPVLNLNASESASYPGSGSTWFDLTPAEYDFTMYSPIFTAKTTSSPGFFTFPGRAFTDPLNTYGEYNGTPAITTESAWTNQVWVRRATNHSSFNQSRISIFANGREDLSGPDNGWALGTLNDNGSASANLMIESSGFGIYDSGSAIPDGEWILLTFVRSGGNISFYINDTFINTQSFLYNTPADGMWIARTANALFSWIGDISIIREYAVALTGTQIADLFKYDLANYIKQPIISYDFSDAACYPGSGSTVFDLAGSLDLQIAGTVAYVSNGQASYFDLGAGATNGNYIGTTGLSGLGNTFTISGWARNKGSAGYPLFTAGYESASGTAPGFYYPTVSTVAGHFNYGVNFTDGPCANNTWNFLTYTVDGTTCKLYVNGILVDSISKAAGSEWGTGAFVFGAAVTAGGGINAPNFITADIATFDVYNVALGSTDVANIYAETSPRFLAPVSYYDPQDPASFNNTTAFNDLNGGTDFVFNSTPTYDSTYGAISFDGSNFAVLSNYLTNTWPTGTAAFTMSFWWKTKANNPNKFAYLFFYGNGPNYIVPFSNYGTEGSVAILDNANHAVRTTNAFSEDVWYHFAFVKPAGGTFLDFTVYVNGIDQGALTDIVGGSATFSMAVTNNNSIRIQENNPGFISGGSLAQIWVYDYEVDGTDILQQYNSTKARYDNLVASYDLNSLVSYPGTGNTLYDLSGSNADITLENTSYYDGASYNSLIFTEASGSRGTFTGDLGLGTTTPVFTFFIWVKPTALSTGYTYGTIVQYGKESGSVGGAPAIYPEWNGNNNLSATFGSGKADINTGTPVTLDEWICLATTCDGTTYKLYRNGSLVGSTALSGAQIVSPQQLVLNYLVNNPTVFQTSFEFNFLNVYNTALSAGDITTLYDDTVSRFTTPPAYQGIAGGRQFAQGFNG
jgi:hypothetical protein